MSDPEVRGGFPEEVTSEQKQVRRDPAAQKWGGGGAEVQQVQSVGGVPGAPGREGEQASWSNVKSGPHSGGGAVGRQEQCLSLRSKNFTLRAMKTHGNDKVGEIGLCLHLMGSS